MALKSRPGAAQIIVATAHALAVVVLGYSMLGPIPALLFSGGFVGGLAAWIAVRARPPFTVFRSAFYVTLGLFVAHKVEERQMEFFPALSNLTGLPVPDTQSVSVYALYALASVWLLVPILAWRRHELGYYLAWSFFASMGFVELAHFAFPLFEPGGYRYFPGMITAILLAPTAWLGIARLGTFR
jgi:hypothetical protein